jgi:hypothetical protein
MHKNTTSPLSAPPWSGLPTVRRALNNRAPTRLIARTADRNTGRRRHTERSFGGGAVVVLKRSIRGPTETYEASRGCTGRTAGPGPGRCRDRDQLARCPGARLGGPAHHTGRLQRHQPVIVILRDAVQGLEGGRSPVRPRAVIYPAVLADRTPGLVLTAATVLYASVWKVAFLLPKNGEGEPQGDSRSSC